MNIWIIMRCHFYSGWISYLRQRSREQVQGEAWSHLQRIPNCPWFWKFWSRLNNYYDRFVSYDNVRRESADSNKNPAWRHMRRSWIEIGLAPPENTSAIRMCEERLQWCEGNFCGQEVRKRCREGDTSLGGTGNSHTHRYCHSRPLASYTDTIASAITTVCQDSTIARRTLSCSRSSTKHINWLRVHWSISTVLTNYLSTLDFLFYYSYTLLWFFRLCSRSPK